MRLVWQEERSSTHWRTSSRMNSPKILLWIDWNSSVRTVGFPSPWTDVLKTVYYVSNATQRLMKYIHYLHGVLASSSSNLSMNRKITTRCPTMIWSQKAPMINVDIRGFRVVQQKELTKYIMTSITLNYSSLIFI